MSPCEQLFDGAHIAHIVAYYERQRLARLLDRCREAAGIRARRPS